MACKGITVHCPGCHGSTNAVPLVIIAAGSWLAYRSPGFGQAVHTLLITTAVTVGSLVILSVAGLILTIRSEHRVTRPAAPAVTRQPAPVTLVSVRSMPVSPPATRPAIAPATRYAAPHEPQSPGRELARLRPRPRT